MVLDWIHTLTLTRIDSFFDRGSFIDLNQLHRVDISGHVKVEINLSKFSLARPARLNAQSQDAGSTAQKNFLDLSSTQNIHFTYFFSRNCVGSPPSLAQKIQPTHLVGWKWQDFFGQAQPTQCSGLVGCTKVTQYKDDNRPHNYSCSSAFSPDVLPTLSSTTRTIGLCLI